MNCAYDHQALVRNSRLLKTMGREALPRLCLTTDRINEFYVKRLHLYPLVHSSRALSLPRTLGFVPLLSTHRSPRTTEMLPFFTEHLLILHLYNLGLETQVGC